MDAPDERYGPGPIDRSVLYLQHKHRSEAVWEDPDVPTLISRYRQAFAHRRMEPHARVLHYVQRAGFLHVHRLGVGFRLDLALISALVERWRQETHTFHLTVGEATITLQDVAIIMGLRVDGPPVTGTANHEWPALCQDLLGRVPPPEALAGSSLRITWLREHFSDLPNDATEEVVQQYARAYILCVIGGLLLPDKSSAKVQLLYLPMLRDFDLCGGLSWGAATLACLYRGLCRASHRTARDITGPLLLLQVWSWERLHVGRPTRIAEAEVDPDIDPLAAHWRVRASSQENPRPHTLPFYRDQLDMQIEEQVNWQPYTDEILQRLPPSCLEGQEIWSAEVPLICFDIVEWHLPSRVMRQFGWVQDIPPTKSTGTTLHKKDRRGMRDTNWEDYRHQYITLWEDRHNYVVNGVRDTTRVAHFGEYMSWYRRITRQHISPIPARRPMVFHPEGGARHFMECGIMHAFERHFDALDALDPTNEVARQAIMDIGNSLRQMHRLFRTIRLVDDVEPNPQQGHDDELLADGVDNPQDMDESD